MPFCCADIGANLTDAMFQGRYNDKEYHPEDLKDVLDRAWAADVERIIITAGSLSEAKAALELARSDSKLHSNLKPASLLHTCRCEIGHWT